MITITLYRHPQGIRRPVLTVSNDDAAREWRTDEELYAYVCSVVNLHRKVFA